MDWTMRLCRPVNPLGRSIECLQDWLEKYHWGWLDVFLAFKQGASFEKKHKQGHFLEKKQKGAFFWEITHIFFPQN